MSEVPAEIVAAAGACARRCETPCGDGTLVWHGWGSGPPLLLFHGSQGAWSQWIRNIDALSQGRSVWAVDLPGQGESAMPPAQSHEAISEALAEGMVRLLGGALPVDIAGFSFGGVVAAHLAAFHPRLVRRLVIIGSGGLDTPVGRLELRRASGLQGEERKEVLRHNLLQIMLHDPASADALALHLLAANAYRSRLDVAPLVLPNKLLKVLAKVRCQVDAIWGEQDRVHFDPHVQFAALRQVKPDAQAHVIRDAGHWAMYEQPERFNRMLLDMLDSPLRVSAAPA